MAKQHLSAHDRFMRSMMTNPKVIDEFFRTNLPQKIQDKIDFSTIKPQKDSFINDALRMQIADLLYSVQVNGEEGFIYILVEHMSSPHKLLPFRMLKYMISIMEHHLKKTKGSTLPFIYPLVIYTGQKAYPYSMNLFDLFDKHKELAKETLLEPYHLIDLTKASDEELKRYRWFGTAAFIAKHIYDPDIMEAFKTIISQLKELDQLGESSYIYTIIT